MPREADIYKLRQGAHSVCKRAGGERTRLEGSRFLHVLLVRRQLHLVLLVRSGRLTWQRLCVVALLSVHLTAARDAAAAGLARAARSTVAARRRSANRRAGDRTPLNHPVRPWLVLGFFVFCWPPKANQIEHKCEKLLLDKTSFSLTEKHNLDGSGGSKNDQNSI